MFNNLKNNKKGFTLMEIVVAIGVMILFGGFAITTIAVIPQARMRSYAQTIKTEFELTRDFAKTHGGDATLTITKTKDGFVVERSGSNLTKETHTIEDGDVAIFYQKTGEVKDVELAEDDSLEMTFSQTHGSIIGPDLLDYLTISNGNKNYKFIIRHSTGVIYYDYEIDESDLEGNYVDNSSIKTVDLPQFIDRRGAFTNDKITLRYSGKSLQPDIKYDARNVKIGGVYRATAGGPFEITFTLKDPYNTRWSDGTVEVKKLTWNIE